MIIRKETVQKDTIRLEFIGRELSVDEKNFLDFTCSWIQGVLSARDQGFVSFAIKQLGNSLDMCSAYLKQHFPKY